MGARPVPVGAEAGSERMLRMANSSGRGPLRAHRRTRSTWPSRPRRCSGARPPSSGSRSSSVPASPARACHEVQSGAAARLRRPGLRPARRRARRHVLLVRRRAVRGDARARRGLRDHDATRRPGDEGAHPLAEGAVGERVKTSLRWEAQPQLRASVGDVYQVHTDPCSCGVPGLRIRVLGRTDDLLIVKGVKIYPAAVKNVVQELPPAARAESSGSCSTHLHRGSSRRSDHRRAGRGSRQAGGAKLAADLREDPPPADDGPARDHSGARRDVRADRPLKEKLIERGPTRPAPSRGPRDEVALESPRPRRRATSSPPDRRTRSRSAARRPPRRRPHALGLEEVEDTRAPRRASGTAPVPRRFPEVERQLVGRSEEPPAGPPRDAPCAGRGSRAARRASARWLSTGLPWPGRSTSTSSSPCGAASRGRAGARAALARVRRAVERAVMTEFEEMWPIRWSPTIASRSASTTKIVSVGLWPGRSPTRRLRPPASTTSPARIVRSTVDGAAGSYPVLAGDRVQLRDRGLGDPVQAHRVRLVGLLSSIWPGRSARKKRRSSSCATTVAPLPLAHGVGEPDVIVVLMREDDLLDVLHPIPVRRERRFELDHRLGPVRSRIDQRQRIALEQVAVHRADGERHGQRDRGHRHARSISHMDYLPTVW